jgi:hypothetical protein
MFQTERATSSGAPYLACFWRDVGNFTTPAPKAFNLCNLLEGRTERSALFPPLAKTGEIPGFPVHSDSRRRVCGFPVRSAFGFLSVAARIL